MKDVVKQIVSMFVKHVLESGNGTSIEDAWQYWNLQDRVDIINELEIQVLDIFYEHKICVCGEDNMIDPGPSLPHKTWCPKA